MGQRSRYYDGDPAYLVRRSSHHVCGEAAKTAAGVQRGVECLCPIALFEEVAQAVTRRVCDFTTNGVATAGAATVATSRSWPAPGVKQVQPAVCSVRQRDDAARVQVRLEVVGPVCVLHDVELEVDVCVRARLEFFRRLQWR